MRAITKRRGRAGLVVLAGFLVVLAACGGDSSDEPEADSPATTVQTVETEALPETTSALEPAAATSTEGTETTAAADLASVPELVNCESNIGPDVPPFYAQYFRCSDISLDGDVVVITSSNLPPHVSYYYGEDSELFEDFDFSRGDEYRPNPNQIEELLFTLRVPLAPVPSGIAVDAATVNLAVGDATDYPLGAAGVALDGVALFNPLAAPGDDIEDEKFTFDSYEGHPQQEGAYHYHAVAPGPLAVLKALGFTTSYVPGEAEIELYGVMCDGTAVMGLNELDGSSPAADLDPQAGHVHDLVTEGRVLLENRYHVHMAPAIGADPRGLTPEAQYYSTCDVTGG
jgi:hypothetical protein